MTLSDEIRALRERVLADLNAAHDYYTDTKYAWRIVGDVIAAGQTFTIQNQATGTETTEAELAARARGYVAEQLAEATFQQFMSVFENFLFDLLRLWLTEYPRSLGKKQVEFGAILDAPDKDAIVAAVVEKELYDVFHSHNTAKLFEYLDSKVHAGCPSPDEIGRIAEAKATRDLLVHNRGIRNKTYEAKAGTFARPQSQPGGRLDVSEHYHRETWELICKVVADLSDALEAKAP